MTTTDEARDRAAQARRELAATLDAIEDKLNLPKRVGAAYRANPVPVVIGGIVAVGTVAGLIAWAIIARRD